MSVHQRPREQIWSKFAVSVHRHQLLNNRLSDLEDRNIGRHESDAAFSIAGTSENVLNRGTIYVEHVFAVITETYMYTKRPFKQLTVGADTTSSGREFHRITIL